MLISSFKEMIEKNFSKSKYNERIKALAYVAGMSKKYNSFDMTLSPDTHAWLKRTLKGICYVSDNITLLSDGSHCVVARDEDTFMRHEKRR